MINNASVAQPSAYEALTPAAIDHQIAVNLTAPMALTHLVLPHMLERGRGYIVNVASLGGLLGIGFGDPYSATKHAPPLVVSRGGRLTTNSNFLMVNGDPASP